MTPLAYENEWLGVPDARAFRFGSALRDGVDNSDALFDAVPGHHPTARMHVCFYPNEEQPFGMFMGEVRFVIGGFGAETARNSSFLGLL